VGAFPGIIAVCVALVFWAVCGALSVVAGSICSPTTTRRLVLVPGGSHVIRVAVAGLSATASTLINLICVALAIFLYVKCVAVFQMAQKHKSKLIFTGVKNIVRGMPKYY
jgi:large-conductance mechanosensitive channel